MLQIGSLIDGKYRILSMIGKGGMSAVYLAINDKANKPWAIKEVRKDGQQNFEVVRQSLLVETDLLKKLNHPNLPSIVDVIDQDENFLIVMDYIEGVTLKSVLDEGGAQDQDDVVAWAIQLCDVLSYLHTRKPAIIYRDMKPSNIMLKSDGKVVLIDFGTAREFKERNIADTTCLGTQGYAAPEQFGGQGQTDPRTDIYCLGATLYHLVTGHNPSEPPYEMYPITEWDESLSTGLEKIIQKCTQKNPADRFQSADELRDALEHFKDLDKPLIKKYKTRLALFISCCTITLLSGIIAGNLQYKISEIKKNEYANTVRQAASVDTQEQALDLYIDAIEVDSTNEDAYLKMLDNMLEDSVLDENEYKKLVALEYDDTNRLQEFKSKNKQGYADFCYEVGRAYWFYYESEASQKKLALPWYQRASEIYEKDAKHQKEYKRCKIYIEMAEFSNKIRNSVEDGIEPGVYSDYWNHLMELKRQNDEERDSDLVTLRLYKEIVTTSMSYATKLKNDKVSLEEIHAVYDEISRDLNEIQTEDEMVVELKEDIFDLMKSAEEILSSSYGR